MTKEQKLRSLIREQAKQMLKEWFPHKEEFRMFEDLYEQQEQIYYDAADVGITPQHKDFSKIKPALQDMVNTYGSKNFKWSGGGTVSIFVPIEMDGDNISGYELKVSFNKDSKLKTIYKKPYDAFFSIDNLERIMISKKDAASKYNYKQFKKSEGVVKEDDYMLGLGMNNDQLGKIKDTSRDTSKDKISIDHWEADEYVVSIKGIGVVGGTLHKLDAQFVKTWLESSLEDLKKSNGNNIVLKTSGGQYFVIKINNETIGQPIYSSKSQALMLEKWLMTAIDEIQKKDSIKNEINLTEQDKFWMGHVGDKDDFQKPIKDEFIDGKTTYGPWGIMSPESFRQFGVGIGLGKGQWYKKQPDGQWKKIKG